MELVGIFRLCLQPIFMFPVAGLGGCELRRDEWRECWSPHYPGSSARHTITASLMNRRSLERVWLGMASDSTDQGRDMETLRCENEELVASSGSVKCVIKPLSPG